MRPTIVQVIILVISLWYLRVAKKQGNTLKFFLLDASSAQINYHHCLFSVSELTERGCFVGGLIACPRSDGEKLTSRLTKAHTRGAEYIQNEWFEQRIRHLGGN